MLKVIDVANKLGVSKVTIYKKMSKFKKELKPYIVKEKNITFVTDEGIELIRNDLPISVAFNENNEGSNYIKEIDSLKSTNNSLQIEMTNIEVEYRRLLMKIIEEKKAEVKRKQEIVKTLKSIIDENKSRISSFEEVSSIDL